MNSGLQRIHSLFTTKLFFSPIGVALRGSNAIGWIVCPGISGSGKVPEVPEGSGRYRKVLESSGFVDERSVRRFRKVRWIPESC